MHLYKIAVMSNNHRIAYLHKLFAQLVQIRLRERLIKMYYEKFRAIAELYIAKYLKIRAFIA